jgi:hypothetical protein
MDSITYLGFPYLFGVPRTGPGSLLGFPILIGILIWVVHLFRLPITYCGFRTQLDLRTYLGFQSSIWDLRTYLGFQYLLDLYFGSRTDWDCADYVLIGIPTYLGFPYLFGIPLLIQIPVFILGFPYYC